MRVNGGGRERREEKERGRRIAMERENSVSNGVENQFIIFTSLLSLHLCPTDCDNLPFLHRVPPQKYWTLEVPPL